MNATNRFAFVSVVLLSLGAAACGSDSKTIQDGPAIGADASPVGSDASPNSGGPDASSDAGPLCSGKQATAGDTTITVTEPGAPDGGLRSAILHVPASYDPSKPTMLVLNFHGLIEPNSLQVTVSHMSDVSDERGFLVAYPAGLNGVVGASWNAGSCCGNAYDDVGFIRDLVKALEKDYCIDERRVFATGLSNGGMMSYRLACDAADVFAAVAPVAGASLADPCAPSRPVPILAFHGTGDTIVPFNGGTDGLYHVLTFPPVSYSIDLWRSLDSCPGATAPTAAEMAEMPKDSTFDGGPSPSIFEGSTQVYKQGDAECGAWTGCKDGSEVELCTIVEGGHAWPGGQPLIGKTSTDIDASRTIIDFFEKHPMP
jgi:polyhydroxybutyrate depolymerase